MTGYAFSSSDLSIDLSWTLLEGDAKVGDIERSQAPHEGFEVLAEDADLTSLTYRDTFTTPNENRFYYYRVGGALLHIGGVPSPQAKEIVRRDRWFLNSARRHSGARLARVKIRRIDGQKCTECWDEVHQKVTKSKCNRCHGTGVINSYFSPIDMRVARTMPFKQRAPQPDQIDQTNVSQFWASNYPLLKPGDLIKMEGLLHRVEQVQFSRSESYVVKQVMTLKRLEVNRNEYKIPWEEEQDDS